MRHGFLLVRKPKGPTSHDVVQTVRKALHERSIGHLGTLDPAAEGLLVLAVGAKALKVIELFNGLSKEYVADIRFGASSTTDDAEGVIEIVAPKAGWTPPDQSALQRILQDHFHGKIDQEPPAFSAIKIAGERAYRKARQGQHARPPARKVEITDTEVIAYEYPDLKLRVACGAGTYIRSIARDLGTLIRSAGYLNGLVRTKIGSWKLDDAVDPADVAWTNVLPLKDVLKHLPSVELSDADFENARCGRAIAIDLKKETIGWHKELPVAIVVPMTDGSGKSHARKVFA